MGPFTAFTDLAAQIEIPRDGTLSRTLYRDDRVRVVAFGFDAGQELTEHTAAAAAIIQVMSGRFRVTLGGEMLDLLPTAWVHMAPGLPHSVVAIERSVMLLTMLQDCPDAT
ncbi:MAG: cupin domain-containing protein [Actinomycetota bacterium]